MQSDTEYYRARVEQEIAAARQATDKGVRARHLELADAYAFRVREIVAQERRSALGLIGDGSFVGLVQASEQAKAIAVPDDRQSTGQEEALPKPGARGLSAVS
jgi:hypothetical protein